MQEQGVQEAYSAKCDSVPELQCQMLSLWGQDHLEDCAEAAVPELQALLTAPDQGATSFLLCWFQYNVTSYIVDVVKLWQLGSNSSI
jgi:hypothetical protein